MRLAACSVAAVFRYVVSGGADPSGCAAHKRCLSLFVWCQRSDCRRWSMGSPGRKDSITWVFWGVASMDSSLDLAFSVGRSSHRA